jgi:hypothetical protein
VPLYGPTSTDASRRLATVDQTKIRPRIAWALRVHPCVISRSCAPLFKQAQERTSRGSTRRENSRSYDGYSDARGEGARRSRSGGRTDRPAASPHTELHRITARGASTARARRTPARALRHVCLCCERSCLSLRTTAATVASYRRCPLSRGPPLEHSRATQDRDLTTVRKRCTPRPFVQARWIGVSSASSFELLL